jgi:hypothetical protein
LGFGTGFVDSLLLAFVAPGMLAIVFHLPLFVVLSGEKLLTVRENFSAYGD